jgi:hypothetical protein
MCLYIIQGYYTFSWLVWVIRNVVQLVLLFS